MGVPTLGSAVNEDVDVPNRMTDGRSGHHGPRTGGKREAGDQ
jgi:hypothetical protein